MHSFCITRLQLCSDGPMPGATNQAKSCLLTWAEHFHRLCPHSRCGRRLSGIHRFQEERDQLVVGNWHRFKLTPPPSRKTLRRTSRNIQRWGRSTPSGTCSLPLRHLCFAWLFCLPMMHLAHAKNAYLVFSGAQHDCHGLVSRQHPSLLCTPSRKTVPYKICPVLCYRLKWRRKIWELRKGERTQTLT